MPKRTPVPVEFASPLSDERAEAVQAGLLGWFATNARDLPWRRTRDPYRILVSEVMLQQTQVDRVIPYFERWLEQFPDVTALAYAPTADVITAWAGLGYNRRAVNLQRTARFVVEERGSVFPDTVDELLTLPGIGPYTSGAIAAFAFERDVAFIDTNMRRVLHRVAFGPDVPDQLRHDREVIPVARQMVPEGRGWEWNQALIEFGALQCTARKPACLICPLQAHCASYPAILGALASVPRGTRKKAEAPFEGSNRFYRGRVIDLLRAAPATGLALAEIGAAVRPGFGPDDLPWIETVVGGLARDGLAVIERSVAEASSTYTASGNGDDRSGDVPETASVRVRLP
ncbi:MAG TPA: A/G-specific adenine glycosylase [Thermomicrobiales bacterium]|jgi:A/G-specific adenine glycosylase|nr:A/G-specific adenine glycosylase [Thermomicrobiales bacterium]